MELTETAEEMVDSRNNQGEVTKSADGRLEFFGCGLPFY